MKMATAKFEYFFDLPPELREQILAHICVFPTGIWVGGGDDGETSVPLPRSSSPGATIFTQQPTTTTRHADSEDEEDEHADPPVNLFLASPVLYRAAGDLYYGRNVFHLDFSSHAWGRKQKSLVAAADGGSGGALWRLVTHPDTARARRRMRSVVVYVRRLGELVAGVLAPALGDMVLNGGLKRVRVDLLELGVRGRGGMGTGDYAGNPALRALLVLLTDPNLEGAGLRVLREQHAWFWCRFHRGGGVPSSSSPQDGGRVEGGGGCVMTRRNGGLRGGFVEVDIPRLVAVCAGDSAEFNIKKVG